MKLSAKQLIQFIISLGLAAAIIYFTISRLSPAERQQILDSISRASLFWLAISAAIGALACVIRAMRWQLLLKATKNEVPFLSALSAVFIMYAGNLLFPRLGEVLRCSVLKKYNDIPLEESLGTMVVERVVDVLCLGLVILLTIFLEPKIGDFLPVEKIHQISTLQIALAIGAGILGLAVLFFTKKIWHPIYTQKIAPIVHRFVQGILSIKKLENPLLFLFYSLFIYVLYWGGVMTCFRALTETENLSSIAGLFCLVTGSFGVVATQGGIGAYQFAISKSLLLYQIPESIGYAVGWLSWGTQTGMLLVGGVAALIFLSLKKTEKK